MKDADENAAAAAREFKKIISKAPHFRNFKLKTQLLFLKFLKKHFQFLSLSSFFNLDGIRQQANYVN